MPTEYFIERTVYYLLLIVLPWGCYYFGKMMKFKKGSNKTLNFWLSCSYGSMICMLVQLLYFLLHTFEAINFKILNALSMVLFPLSILGGIIFLCIYWITRMKIAVR